MPKKAGIAIVILGAVLILSALLLYIYNRQEDAQAGQEAESLLERLETVIPTQTADEASAVSPAGTEVATDSNQAALDSSVPAVTPDESGSAMDYEHTVLDPEMPTVTLDGYEYIGCVEIPALELKLPVMSDWDYSRLKIAPCRQFGSSRTDDLVIAAHNYESHFGRLKDLSLGDTVIFTDMDGIVSIYCIEKIETLNPTEVDAVQNSGYDLVLYTCTKGGKTRVVVFCNRIASPISLPLSSGE